jgi:hypothetical protein
MMITGTIVEAGYDPDIGHRLVIETSKEQLRDFPINLIYAQVEVRLRLEQRDRECPILIRKNNERKHDKRTSTEKRSGH